jgi:hypothetical protein
MGRTIAGVIAGFAVIAALNMLATFAAVKTLLPAANGVSMPRPTATYLAVNLTYSAFFAVLGGYVAATIAARAPLLHTAVLGGILVVVSIVSYVQNAGQQPRWYAISLMALGPVCVIAGGYLRATGQR